MHKNKCKCRTYKKRAISDTGLENAMDKSIEGIAFNPNVAVQRRKRRGCY